MSSQDDIVTAYTTAVTTTTSAFITAVLNYQNSLAVVLLQVPTLDSDHLAEIGAADHSEISNTNSNHPGGCNVLFGDGSVRFIKSTLNLNVWWALGTRSNGEVISSDSY